MSVAELHLIPFYSARRAFASHCALTVMFARRGALLPQFCFRLFRRSSVGESAVLIRRGSQVQFLPPGQK